MTTQQDIAENLKALLTEEEIRQARVQAARRALQSHRDMSALANQVLHGRRDSYSHVIVALRLILRAKTEEQLEEMIDADQETA